jgi:hypothetical protein
LTVAEADGVDVDVSEATERFAGSRPVVVERSDAAGVTSVSYSLP